MSARGHDVVEGVGGMDGVEPVVPGNMNVDGIADPRPSRKRATSHVNRGGAPRCVSRRALPSVPVRDGPLKLLEGRFAAERWYGGETGKPLRVLLDDAGAEIVPPLALFQGGDGIGLSAWPCRYLPHP